MPAERVTINPVTEDSSLAPLDLVGLDPSWGIYLLEHGYPPPKPESQRSGNVDTEGEAITSTKWGNRFIPLRLRLVEPGDAAATNLVPNPNFELGLTGWEFSSGSFTEPTRTQQPTPELLSANGTDYAMRLRAVKDNTATERFAAAQTLSGLNGIPVVAGTTYTQAWYLYVADAPNKGGANNFVPEINWYDAAGVLLSTSAGGSVLIGSGEATRIVHTAAAPALAAFCRLKLVGVTNTALDVVDYYVDRVQLTATAAATAYFDGDTPGCDWTGARHATTSSRPAPDGTRFSRIYRDVMAQIDRLKRERYGFLRRKAPGFKPLVFDLQAVEVTDAPADISIGMKRAEIAFTYEAEPGGRGPEVQIGGNFDELAKPALTLLAENVPGDMPALGRLRLEDRQGQAQLAAWWGLQQAYYSASADAELFYEAETRTPLGASATAALAGASGAGNNTILNANLVNAYQAVMSTQKAGGGNHLSHIGSFRVLARLVRPVLNTGEVTVRLAWADGDFQNVTENDPVVFGIGESEGSEGTIEDLGVVTLEKAPAGVTQRWEGRVLAKSTVTGDDIYVDWLLLVPVSEGSGEARASSEPAPPTAYTAFDPFQQEPAGALAGKAAPIGGNWAGAGDADDFTIDGANDWLTRTAVSDVAGTPRYAILGETKYTDVYVAVDVSNSNPEPSNPGTMAVMARYVDTNNWARFALYPEFVQLGRWEWSGKLEKKVAGVVSIYFIFGILFPATLVSSPVGQKLPWTRLELTILSTGEWRLGLNGEQLRSAIDTDFAAAGPLKEGKVGLQDEKTTAVAATRYYDNFQAYTPSIDRAIYPNRVLEITSDIARRQDSAGLVWGDAPYEGDYLLIPPAGPEKRVSRIVAKASRNPEADAGIDDLRATLFVTPRYLVAPPT